MDNLPALTAFDFKHFAGTFEVLDFKLLDFEHSWYPWCAQVGQEMAHTVWFIRFGAQSFTTLAYYDRESQLELVICM